MSVSTIEELLKNFRAGDRRACAQIISSVEDELPIAQELLTQLHPLMGKAYRIGITGPPGAGKSTLVEKLTRHLRQENFTVGVVAVDPSSPFSGGAVLGDRVRMSSLFTDPGVYIRSMATRGSIGGLARRTKEVCDILDAFGKDYIIIETVGVGQMELDIAEAADSTIVVLVPESGDSIQALKAGLMEIGEIYCVNKSDREGADRMVLEIETILELRPKNNSWTPPVIKTSALTGTGIAELYQQIVNHRQYQEKLDMLSRRRYQVFRQEIRRLIEEKITSNFWQKPGIEQEFERLLIQVASRKISPYQAADQIINQFWKGE